ncbi:hypothetical protein A0256_05710 [Mucilaginibacter sp. PAMC 26640]|nr:hypothetical protein A0256_05710 [Mucilaginibacter sp. PAMC 26640]
MKYLYAIATMMICCTMLSCSKKSNPAPMAHTIKVTATGTADYTVVLSVIKSDATTGTPLETKPVSGGSYDYSTSLNPGDLVHLEIQTSLANTISYSITDNGAPGTSENGRELGSFSKLTADYTVN